MVVWLAHKSDESICKPSNLKEVTLFMVPVGVERNGRFERAKGPSIISLVLVVFISMLFSFAQERRFDKKVDISVLACFGNNSVRVVYLDT